MDAINFNQVNNIRFQSSKSEEDSHADKKQTNEEGTKLPSYEECGSLVPQSKGKDSPILEIPFLNVQELSSSRFYKPNIFLGNTLKYREEGYFNAVKDAGIETVIDLFGRSDEYKQKVENAGMKYYSCPLDLCHRCGHIDEQDKDNIVNFIKEVQKDNVYMSYDEYHPWVADEAAFLNSFFNPDFKGGVRRSESAGAEYSHTKSFARNIYSYMTEEDKEFLNWPDGFDEIVRDKIDWDKN